MLDNCDCSSYLFLCVCVCVCVCARARSIAQSCLTLCDRMDCSPPGCSVHGIFQARTLGWVACPPPLDLPDPGIEPGSPVSPALAGRFFNRRATWGAIFFVQLKPSHYLKLSPYATCLEKYSLISFSFESILFTANHPLNYELVQNRGYEFHLKMFRAECSTHSRCSVNI